SRVGIGSGKLPTNHGAGCMCTVLDNPDVRSEKIPHTTDGHWRAERVLDENRLGAGSAAAFNLCQIGVERRRVDIRVHRARAGEHYRGGHNEARKTGDDELIASANSERGENGEQRLPSAAECNRVRNAGDFRKRSLQVTTRAVGYF